MTGHNVEKDWRRLLFLAGFICFFIVERIVSLGIAGEPSSLHPLFLLNQLSNAPESREGEYSQNDRDKKVVYHQGQRRSDDTYEEKKPPAALAEIVFCLDDYGMKQTYDEKRCDAYNESKEMHIDSIFERVAMYRLK